MMVDLNRRRKTPLHDQIRAQIGRLIGEGILPPDARLPGTREMARLLHVSRNTVLRAYDELVADGCLKVIPRKGIFVESGCRLRGAPPARPAAAVTTGFNAFNAWTELLSRQGSRAEFLEGLNPSEDARPDLIRFTGEPVLEDESWVERLRAAFRDVLAREGTRLLGYAPAQGYEPFREFLVERLRRHGIRSASLQGLLVVNGFREGLSLLTQTLIEPGDPVVTEDPTYPAALDILRYAGARIVGIPVDDEGMRIDCLEAQLQQLQPKFVYTIPTHHNPTGTTLSHTRRQQLLELCARHRVLIVEDLFSDELLCGGCFVVPLHAMAEPGQVLSIGTFSKVICPALRVGWVAGPPELVRRLTVAKAITDSFTNTISQAAIVEYASQGYLDPHLTTARREYRARRDRLAALLPEFLPPGSHWPLTEAHLSVWVRLPEGGSNGAVSSAAASARFGVAFREGARCYVNGGGGNHLGLSVMSVTLPRIRPGLERLAAYLGQEYLKEGRGRWRRSPGGTGAKAGDFDASAS